MKETLLATGGALSALAASTCCIIPLILAFAGLGGAWGAVLAPYQPLFIAVAVGCLGAGFWLVYGKGKSSYETDVCRSSTSGQLIKSVLLVKAVLWLGALLVTLSLGVDVGARIL